MALCICSCLFLYLLSLIVLALVAVKIYVWKTTGYYKITKDLAGKTVLVTGGTAGVGKETCRELARAGARVYIICRDVKKGNATAEEIKEETKNSQIFVMACDMSKLSSVRQFAEEFRQKNERIDILINNAGQLTPNYTKKPELTEDKLEQTMQVNHFAPYLLTRLLLDLIVKSAPSRIINVSSEGHQWVSNFDVDNLDFHVNYSPVQSYRWSKLCNILFTRSLAERLKGKGVTAYSLHPGFVQTQLFDHVRHWRRYIYKALMPFSKTPLQGAMTSLYCAVEPKLDHVSGHYFADCKPAATTLPALDDDIAEKLWIKSAEATGLQS